VGSPRRCRASEDGNAEPTVITPHPIEGIEFVEEAVAALGSSTELADHLFRECWAVGTGSGRTLGWTGREIEAHKFKVAMAADLVALWHNGRITVDRGQKEVSGAGHARSVAAS
jgi:NAD(P)H-hydrate repair Nnr-like enzyme with NAD(P)H-hydrate dehydratase domain